ncbi:hypothetical protein RF11_11170 [Thelohanellus kitauei]|uniref:Uncharacterized protein n=1 Tax=Thelohanellus kitauei TaxID=669202 RepID=A0A0C2MFG6_THEKT|nr:hypothetical protein RF11_11170 [Thelohanellus kitauei]
MSFVHSALVVNQTHRPQIPIQLFGFDILDEYSKLLADIHFLQYESGADDADRTLIFASDDNLDHLLRHRYWLADGILKFLLPSERMPIWCEPCTTLTARRRVPFGVLPYMYVDNGVFAVDAKSVQKCTDAEGSLDTQQSFFTKAKEHNKSTVFDSYSIALLLAREKKPFIDTAEIIKPVLHIDARMLDDKTAKKLIGSG